MNCRSWIPEGEIVTPSPQSWIYPPYHALSWFASLVLLAALGCGGPARTSVKGTVTKDNSSIVSGTVKFLVGEQSVSAPIREDGTYLITGVPVGQATVLVTSPPPPVQSGPEIFQGISGKMEERRRKALEEKESKKKLLRSKWVLIPPRYADKDTTPLRFEVKHGEDNVFCISIEAE
jgi:hypothetical protein